MRNSPWHWVASLFAAEEIPACIVTYVALLMFLQTHTTPAMATCYCGLLFLPWILKSLLRKRVGQVGHYRRQVQWLELAIVAVLAGIAFVFLHRGWRSQLLFVSLFLLSLLTAWHELAARMYYERMLNPHERRLWNRPKMLFSLLAVVLTYGVFIIFVGGLQVIHRSIARAWNEGCYLVAGISLLFALYHILSLRKHPSGDSTVFIDSIASGNSRIYSAFGILGKSAPSIRSAVFVLFLLLLPQSLMFYSRVLFLLAPRAGGGLGCTLIDVGFAQGVVGVIAFCVGIVLGRLWQKRQRCAIDFTEALPWQAKDKGVPRVFWPMAVSLGLSPAVYLLIVHWPPASLLSLSVATFCAQFFFGFGLNATMPFVRHVSGNRYRSTVNYLYIPVISTVMLLPMILSGWLVEWLGFRLFFLADTLTAPLAWLYAARVAKR